MAQLSAVKALGIFGKMFGVEPDAMLAGLYELGRDQAAPHLGRLRLFLIAHVAGEPPASLRAELERQGLIVEGDADVDAIWRACIAAAGGKPVDLSQLEAVHG